MTGTRNDQHARRCRAVVAGGLVFLADQVASRRHRPADSRGLAKVDDRVERARPLKSRPVNVRVWLKSLEDFDAMKRVYDAWVVPGQTLARACSKVEPT